MSLHDRIRLIGSLSFDTMRRRLWTILLVLYAAAIFAQSHTSVGGGAPLFPHADKCLHAAAFAVFFALAWKATGRRPILSLVLTAVYAGTDELHQFFVAARTASSLDYIADLVGALLGLGLVAAGERLWAFLRRRILRPRHTKVES